MFDFITEILIEFIKTHNILASSWVELPQKCKNSESIINLQNNDKFCFCLWCILAHLYRIDINKIIPSSYVNNFYALNTDGLEFPMKGKVIPEFEKPNRLIISVFHFDNVLSPLLFNKNYFQPQIDLLLYENHFCLITKLHMQINKDSHMKHICRRC